MIPASMQAHRRPFQHYAARHFHWACSEDGRVATITLNRPDKKNPLTLESYAELRDFFRALAYAPDIHAVVITGEVDGTVYLLENDKKRGIGNSLVELVDVQGRLQSSEQLEAGAVGEHAIAGTRALGAGVYFIRTRSVEGVQAARVVVVR